MRSSRLAAHVLNDAGARPALLVLAAICLCVVCCTVAGRGAERMQSGPVGSWRTIRMRVTAYCPCRKCCGKYSGGKTASGHTIRQGDTFVAADRIHSFGTQIVVPGYNESRPVAVLDRGGAIRGNRLDVFFNSHHRAKQWGIKHLPVKVRAG